LGALRVANTKIIDDKCEYKIIDDKCEYNIVCVMFPEAGCEVAGLVSVWGQECNKCVVGNASCMGEAILHASFNADIEAAVGFNKVPQLIQIHDGIGDCVASDTHIFEIYERGSKEEILDIHDHEPPICGGDHAVEEAFGSAEVGSLGACVEQILNAVATDCPANAGWILFIRSMCAYNA
jgi:hypothetical protein